MERQSVSFNISGNFIFQKLLINAMGKSILKEIKLNFFKNLLVIKLVLLKMNPKIIYPNTPKTVENKLVTYA